VAGQDLLARSYRAALEQGYRWHEFGDSHLILGTRSKETDGGLASRG
jgi:S-adenosylmethionine:tRNA ribosyltransferase-isomerase